MRAQYSAAYVYLVILTVAFGLQHQQVLGVFLGLIGFLLV
jgi:hypothetical protein